MVIPGILPDLYRDQRILLGWAWTYLIVAELIGTTSGITWFITQQARYQHFANVYAAIIIIGIIGLGTDMVLALLGRRLFPWDRTLGEDRLNVETTTVTSSIRCSRPDTDPALLSRAVAGGARAVRAPEGARSDPQRASI